VATDHVLPVAAVISDQTLFESMPAMQCPTCGDTHVHTVEPRLIDSGDKWGGAAGWPGRGSMLVVPVEGECGHRFDICFGFHKGATSMFVRNGNDGPR
jgi:hypothetical protein